MTIVLISDEDTTDAINIDATAGGIDIDAVGEAGQDIAITNTGGSLILTATEAATDAIVLNASTAAGGIDIASNEDIDITTTGAAGEDITLQNTGGSVIITATEAITDAIVIQATTAGGGIDIASQEDIDITTTGAAGEDISITNTGGSINITSTEANVTDGIVINATGGIDMDSSGITSITSNRNNAQAILINSLIGGIDIFASGAADGEDIDITATGSSVFITSTQAAANAIVLNASAGGVDITAATNAMDLIATTDDINLTGNVNIDLIATTQDITMQTGDDFNITLGDVSTWTMAAGSQIVIDAATTANTTTTGVIDLNYSSATSGAIGLDIDATLTGIANGYGANIAVTTIGSGSTDVEGLYVGITNDDTTAGDNVYGAVIDLDNNASTNDDNVYGLVVNTDDGVAVPDAFIYLVNQDVNQAVTDGILFNIETGGGITDAIDASDADITNAINIGTNFILFDGIRAAELASGTLTIEDTSGNDLLTVTDAGTVGNLTVTGLITSNAYRVTNGTNITGADGNNDLTKANLQAASHWSVSIAAGSATVRLGSDAALDAADVGRKITFALTTGNAAKTLTVTGVNITVTNLIAAGAATTVEDTGDYIECLITGAATATCVAYGAD